MKEFKNNSINSPNQKIEVNRKYDFGELLRRRRTDLGKSIRQIAKVLGLKESTVNSWEIGQSFPIEKLSERTVTSAEIAEAYGLELEEFSTTLEISKKARGTEKDSPKNVKPPKKRSIEDTDYSSFPPPRQPSQWDPYMRHKSHIRNIKKEEE